MTRNAALDKTQHVGELALGAAHRTEEAHARAGGKGLDGAPVAGAGVAVVRSTAS